MPSPNDTTTAKCAYFQYTCTHVQGYSTSVLVQSHKYITLDTNRLRVGRTEPNAAPCCKTERSAPWSRTACGKRDHQDQRKTGNILIRIDTNTIRLGEGEEVPALCKDTCACFASALCQRHVYERYCEPFGNYMSCDLGKKAVSDMNNWPLLTAECG